MHKIIELAGSAAHRTLEALVGSEHYPVGGVLDIGWQVDRKEGVADAP
ncbi:MAG: hypothetical protein HKN78_07645 [Sphingomonadaceae bacterium]|nr:hypothetical protein [Sphingomonadaceae bacterium]